MLNQEVITVGNSFTLGRSVSNKICPSLTDVRLSWRSVKEKLRADLTFKTEFQSAPQQCGCPSRSWYCYTVVYREWNDVDLLPYNSSDADLELDMMKWRKRPKYLIKNGLQRWSKRVLTDNFYTFRITLGCCARHRMKSKLEQFTTELHFTGIPGMCTLQLNARVIFTVTQVV